MFNIIMEVDNNTVLYFSQTFILCLSTQFSNSVVDPLNVQ